MPVVRGNLIRDTLNVVETIYHQRVGEQPVSFESRFTIKLATEEQVWDRRQTATEEWAPLQCGWIAGLPSGMIHIANEEGKFPHTQPSEEEIEAVQHKILELVYAETLENPAIDNPSRYAWRILPGASMRAMPASITDLRIRCLLGTAKFSLRAFPG